MEKRSLKKLVNNKMNNFEISKLEYWNSERANKIEGTDGSFNPPFMKRDQNIFTFNPELCR